MTSGNGSSHSLNHQRRGAGPALVLLHGVGHHLQAWGPIVDRLSGSFDVIAVDSPGFGASAPLPDGRRPTIPAYAEAISGFLAELGVTRPHVAGNSMGGAIGLELARRGAVSSVTAFSPAGFWSPGERRYAQSSLQAVGAIPPAVQPALRSLARTRAGRAALFAQLAARPGAMPPDEAEGTLRDLWASTVFADALSAFDDYDFRDGHELTVPVTVAWGAKDRLLPYGRQAPRAKAALPQATHVALNTGHLPYTDDADTTEATIRATVARAGDGPAGRSA